MKQKMSEAIDLRPSGLELVDILCSNRPSKLNYSFFILWWSQWTHSKDVPHSEVARNFNLGSPRCPMSSSMAWDQCRIKDRNDSTTKWKWSRKSFEKHTCNTAFWWNYISPDKLEKQFDIFVHFYCGDTGFVVGRFLKALVIGHASA